MPSLRIQLQEISPTLDISKQVGIIATTFEKREFILIVTFSLPSPSSLLMLPIITIEAGLTLILVDTKIIIHLSGDE